MSQSEKEALALFKMGNGGSNQLAAGPLAHHPTFLGLSFLIHKMGLIILTAYGCCEDKWNNKQITYKFLYICHKRTGRMYNLQQTATGRFLLERGLEVAARDDKDWHVLFQTF